MTTRLILLVAVLLCWAAFAQGQTIKSLGFNTNDGRIVYSGTSPLTFTNAVSFGHPNESTPAFGTEVVIYGNLTMNSYESSGETPATLSVGSFIATGFGPGSNIVTVSYDNGITFGGDAAGLTRTNLGLSLPALTNTSNVTTMRALAGSTNTNQPFSGSISVVGTNNTNTLVFSNGILLSQ